MSRDLVKPNKGRTPGYEFLLGIGRPSHAGSLTIMGICDRTADDEGWHAPQGTILDDPHQETLKAATAVDGSSSGISHR
jgi:hypothetical protein